MEMLRCGISDQLILLLLVLAINPSEAAPLTLVNGEGIVRINKVNRITDSYTIITANVRTREQGGELEGASDSWKLRGEGDLLQESLGTVGTSHEGRPQSLWIFLAPLPL